MSSPPAPRTVRDAAGTRRYEGRRLGRLAGTVVVCPDERKSARVLRAGDAHFGLECQHGRFGGAIDADTRDAPHWLYLLPDAGGGTLVVECHADEVRHIVAQRFSLAELRAYLGLSAAQAA